MKQRVISLILAMTMIISVFVVIPITVSADTPFDNLTCSSFISNTTSRDYIDTMMKYYLSENSDIVTALDNGKSAIFMFEGGSDNYSASSYSASSDNIRTQAVCIVIQKVNGSYSIVFYNENSSSIPSQPQATSGGSNDGQTTLLDGIYKVKTWNHQGKYGALQIITNKGYYTPPSNLNGVINTASGINIHTRTSSIAESGGSAWSWGCQLIGFGNNTSNAFNTFMKTVTGITYNVWNYWGSFKTITTDIDAGYYILDRQLALKGLASLYNSTALSNITAASRTAYEDANATYMNKCTYYPSYCDIRFNQSTKAYSYPCTTETNSESTVIATIPEGQEVKAYALYHNDKGEYWYRIITYGTTPAYVYAGHTEFIRERFDDVRMEDANAPQNIELGALFTIKGTAKSDYNKITGISAYALNGFDVNGSVATGGNDSISGNSYVLKDSKVDDKLLFDELAAGNYTYIIFVNAENHHATSGTTKTSSVTAMVMKEAYFTVGGTTPVYTILLNANGGKGGVTSQPKISGTALTLTTNVPTREGYEFIGWSESIDATSATYRAGDSFAADSDTTLYAVWKQLDGNETPDYTNIALGKNYVISGCGNGYSQYVANLTDGNATTTLTYDNNWFAFYYNKDAEASVVNAPDGIGSVVIDLGAQYDLSSIKINMINNVGADILPPEAVKVYLSNDGNDFTEATFMPIFQVENTSYWNESPISGVARYIKVEIKLSGSFAFLNEIEVYGEEYNATPNEPDVPSDEPDTPIIMLGDVNDDKIVDAVDYLLVKRACFKTYELLEDEKIRADVNCDELIESTDYLLVKRIAFGTYTV